MPENQNSNQTWSSLSGKLRIVTRTISIIIVTISIIFSGLFVWQNFFQQKYTQDISESGKDKFTVTVDKTVIIQQVQELQKLETIKQIIQREISVTIDLGELEFFGVSVLENKRTQEFLITGYVTAGIDLSLVTAEDIKVSSTEKEVLIRLPSPQILEVNIIEDQSRILREEITMLYNLETLNTDRRKELNELLFQKVIGESRRALVNASCQDEILLKAQTNATDSMQKLFGKIFSENFYIETTSASSCGFDGV